MKKNNLISRDVLVVLLTITVMAIGVVSTTFGRSDENKSPRSNPVNLVGSEQTMKTNHKEEKALVGKLIQDGLIDEFKGFVVEKIQDKLLLNGKEQTPELAQKYFGKITKEIIRVRLNSFADRQRQHPEISIMELLSPISFSSTMIDYNPNSEGC